MGTKKANAPTHNARAHLTNQDPGTKRRAGVSERNYECLGADARWILGHPELDDDTIIGVIDRELDNTEPDGPYRSGRALLNRIRRRVLRRREGKDPMVFSVGSKGNPRMLRGGDRANYKLKRQVVRIMDELDRAESPEWWSKYK